MLDLCTSTKHRANDNPVTMFPLFAKDRRAKLPYRAPVGALAASGMSAVRSATVRAMRVMVGEVLVRGGFARHPIPGLGGVRAGAAQRLSVLGGYAVIAGSRLLAQAACGKAVSIQPQNCRADPFPTQATHSRLPFLSIRPLTIGTRSVNCAKRDGGLSLKTRS